MENITATGIREEIIGNVAVDLLSIPHLIFKIVRRKVILNSLNELDKDIKFPHIEILSILKDEGTLNIREICDRLLIAKAKAVARLTFTVDWVYMGHCFPS